MGFLRRLFGAGAQASQGDEGDERGTEPSTPEDPAADEAARERDLLRADPARRDDDLIQRQLRYADRSWMPPAQGGDRRADDEAGDAPDADTR